MPTPRKRIGYLPSADVQKIIDKICMKNNLSQSKVTGILVEEALKARNLYRLKNNENFKSIDLKDDFYNLNISNNSNTIANKFNGIAKDQEYMLVKEYLNYKNFKRILSIVQSDS